MIPRPCLDCAEPTDLGSRCEDCQRKRDAQVRPRSYGRERAMYDAGHRRRSIRLRRMQPFCLDCGSRERLTIDHTERAAARIDAGLEPRDEDHDVVCVRCNDRRGPMRGRT